MDIDTLNTRYGAPGRIVFRSGFAGYPNVVLAGKYGSAEIALLGATALSYRPTGHSEVLFRPAKGDGDYNRGDKFHGGIPVCWPQFGKCFSQELPQHGFASKLVFDVRGSQYSEEQTEVTLGIASNAETRKLWPHDFDFEVKITVSMKLNIRLTTTNTGTDPFAFSCGLHPYFRVRDLNGVTVRGLDGCAFVDARGEKPVEGRQAGDLVFPGERDHVYTMPSAIRHEYAILDGGLRRAIAIASAGNDCTVVWNPDTQYVVDDHAADDWRKFVCVEPVTDWPGGRTLAPGAKHELLAAFQSVAN